MSDPQSTLKRTLKEIDELCAEIEVGLAGLADELPKEAVSKLRSWIRRSPRRIDECFLAVEERKCLRESCIAWLSVSGYRVFPAQPHEVRGREALMLWRSELRKLPLDNSECCVFIRGLNLLTEGEQMALWASWVGAKLPPSKARFAYSFVPWTEEFDSVEKSYVCLKISDRTSHYITHA